MGQLDDFLEELTARLRLTPESALRMIEEAETHLRDAVEEEMALGADPVTAEERALARFGTALHVAHAANGGRWRVVGPSLNAVAQLLAVGCAAVIAGTLLAEALSWFTSTSWVFGLRSSFAPSTSQISHWWQVQPQAHDWRQAAALENASDSLVLRGLAGVFGLLTAWILHLVGRHHTRVGGGVLPAVGLTAFGTAAVLLVTGSLSTVDWGRGQAVCDGLVALVVAAGYAVTCARSALVTSSLTAAGEQTS
jgi:hypothetical protein